MLKILAIIIELFASIFVLWVLTLLSTLLHEFGHAIGYMLARGDRQWHIRVGWGKRLLNTKALTVNLLVDSLGRSCLFSPAARRTFGSEIRRVLLSIRFFCCRRDCILFECRVFYQSVHSGFIHCSGSLFLWGDKGAGNRRSSNNPCHQKARRMNPGAGALRIQ